MPRNVWTRVRCRKICANSVPVCTRDPWNLIGQIFSHESDDVSAHAVPNQMQTFDAPRHVVRYLVQYHRDVFADVFGPHFRAGVRQIGRVLSPVHADHVVIAHV